MGYSLVQIFFIELRKEKKNFDCRFLTLSHYYNDYKVYNKKSGIIKYLIYTLNSCQDVFNIVIILPIYNYLFFQ